MNFEQDFRGRHRVSAGANARPKFRWARWGCYSLAHTSERTGGAQFGAQFLEQRSSSSPGIAWGPPVPPPDQLAEPVGGRPRILEVPEVAPPAPALGGITIEAVERAEVEKRPGIDIPLQSAPLGRRLAAALIDGLIVVAASTLFGFIFWKLAAVQPAAVADSGAGRGEFRLCSGQHINIC